MWGIFEVFADTIIVCTMTALTILCSGVALTGAAVEYLFGLKAVPVYKLIFILIIFIGCNASLQLVVDISDTFNGFMALPNLVAITLLSGQVVQMTKDFIGRVKAGKETINGDEVA